MMEKIIKLRKKIKIKPRKTLRKTEFEKDWIASKEDSSHSMMNMFPHYLECFQNMYLKTFGMY